MCPLVDSYSQAWEPSPAMLQVREIKAAAVGMAVMALYFLLVLGSGRVDHADFGALLANYHAGLVPPLCMSMARSFFTDVLGGRVQ